MPADHFSITVPEAKLDELATFLTESLVPIGFKELARPIPLVVGFGEKAPYFWLSTIKLTGDEAKGFEAGLKTQHIAFAASNSEEVRQFHVAALKAGGICNGKPGLRAHYHPGYYASYVRDPACGINFEVVFHGGDNHSRGDHRIGFKYYTGEKRIASARKLLDGSHGWNNLATRSSKSTISYSQGINTDCSKGAHLIKAAMI